MPACPASRLRLADFDYDLPRERIAQEPAHRREDARLLIVSRSAASLEDRTIRSLPEQLRAGDLLVINDTRVRPARLAGRKRSGGLVEVLLLGPTSSDGGEELWRCLVRTSGRVREGLELELDGGLVGRVTRAPGAGSSVVTMALDAASGETVDTILERCGQVPLPPYIHRHPCDPRSALDRRRYQTVFARYTGSAAAPTAGLHLTEPLLEALGRSGVGVATITLHVGLGTFEPMRADEIEAHRMHAEWCRLPRETAVAMRETRRRGGRIVAVGTTVVRTLEARWSTDGPVAGEGAVDLFIRPGHRFQAVDLLLTNFHLPRSTLLVLVSAFAGRERILAAYREAIRRGYRFFSYGDAMLILP